MTIGENIKRLREERQMTQEDLAVAAGYKSRSSIGKIENGDSDPTQRNLVRIAKALNVNPVDLLAAPAQVYAMGADAGGGLSRSKTRISGARHGAADGT